jgi:probable F420-dependent oxidoreductase
MSTQFGVTIFPTDYTISPAQVAREAEDRGFESVWFPEHSHIPASRVSPWPGGPDLPSFYHEVLDPFVALGAAAGATSKIKLATGICLVVERDPIFLAKEVTTLDRVSNGRFLFGIGGGWNAEEMENHGTAYKTRFKLMRERILAMKEIWTKSNPSFRGDFVNFDEMLPGPTPVQTPYPPIHVGGVWPHAAKRAIDYGNGWMPIFGRALDPATMFADFRKMAADEGRDPKSLEVTVYGVPPKPENVDDLLAAGADRIVFGIPVASADQVLPALDAQAKLMSAVAA